MKYAGFVERFLRPEYLVEDKQLALKSEGTGLHLVSQAHVLQKLRDQIRYVTFEKDPVFYQTDNVGACTSLSAFAWCEKRRQRMMALDSCGMADLSSISA